METLPIESNLAVTLPFVTWTGWMVIWSWPTLQGSGNVVDMPYAWTLRPPEITPPGVLSLALVSFGPSLKNVFVPPNTISASMTVKGVLAVGSVTSTSNGDNPEDGGFAAPTLTSLLYGLDCGGVDPPREYPGRLHVSDGGHVSFGESEASALIRVIVIVLKNRSCTLIWIVPVIVPYNLVVFTTADAPGVQPSAPEGEVNLAVGAVMSNRMLDLDQDLRAVDDSDLARK